MYERMLDKTSKPTFDTLVDYCGEQGPLFLGLDMFMKATPDMKSEIRFPYGNKYGWGIKYSCKTRYICDVFTDKNAFTVLLLLTNAQAKKVFNSLSLYGRLAWESKYPCGDGGWVHYRVLFDEMLVDVKLLLTVKMKRKGGNPHMPNLLKQIPQTMRKQGIPEETIARMYIPATGGAEDVMALIMQMDKLLTKEQCLAVMQEQGCCKTGIGPAAHRAFGEANSGKTLQEKVALLNDTQMPHRAPCRLNEDGTLSVFWGSEELKKGSCPCGFVKRLPQNYEIPRTFCGCCGGHIRNNYQKSLGVKLRLIEIVSSSSSSGGKKRCEFLFEVMKGK